MRASRLLVLPLAAAAVALAACSDDPTSPRIDPTLVRVDSLDAATAWTYVTLGAPGVALPLTDTQAATSTAWDLAFKGYEVKINSGETGPGAVTALCLCGNTRAVAAQAPAAQVAFFRALTAESEAADYVAVTPDSVRDASAFLADTISSIRGWWSQDANGRRTLRTPAGVYIVHRPNGTGYAKVQFTAIQNQTGDTPGQVSFQFATLPPSRAAYSATQTATVTVPAGGGRVYYSFANGVVTANDQYDLLFTGWKVRTNSGALANATTLRSWGAYDATRDLGPNNTTSFDATGTRAAATTPFGYVPDGAGVFNVSPVWFYDFTSNTPYPNYDVYLLRKGSAVWKLQVIRQPREATFGSGTWISRYVLFRTTQLR